MNNDLEFCVPARPAGLVVVRFGGARLRTSRLARTLAPPKVAKRTSTAGLIVFSSPGGCVKVVVSQTRKIV